MRPRPITDPSPQDEQDLPCRTLTLGPVRLVLTQVSHVSPEAPASPASRLGEAARTTWTVQGQAPLLGPSAGCGAPMCRLALAWDGPLAVRLGPYSEDLRQGELMLWDSAQDLVAAPAGGERTVRVIAWELPRTLLTVSDEAWLALVGRPVPARWGPAALLARFLEGLAQQSRELTFPSAGLLGAALGNLTVALVADLAGTGTGAAPVPGHRAALLADVKRYVEDRPADPGLTPGAIAAAHHISPRSLHQLFRADGRTVGGYVRQVRLEHCRADLSDPRLAGLSVGEIRARWGFGDAAVFCRAFKRAYGMSPAAYRARHTPPSGTAAVLPLQSLAGAAAAPPRPVAGHAGPPARSAPAGP
jgi:AraC-like DNA-binding protein